MAINLLPEQFQERRRKAGARRLSVFGAVALLVGVVAVTVGVLAFKAVLAAEIGGLEKSIGDEKAKIVSQKEVELKALTLEKKLAATVKTLREANHYSELLSTLAGTVPGEISLLDLQLSSPTKFSLSGTAGDYVSLARFIRALVDPSRGGKIFADAGVRSVDLDSQTGGARFALELEIRKGVLYGVE